MLLANIVETASSVAATAARNGKVALLADLLRATPPDDVAPAIGFLTGEPRQGRVGIGWATAWRAEGGAADEPTLTVADLDTFFARVQETVGKGSGKARSALVAELLQRATEPETDFIRRLFVGEMRQGALEGVVTEAVARAADVSSSAVRRALMLSGDLGRTAEVALALGEAGLGEIGLEVLRPVLPMLASTADSTADALAVAGRASVEWKLDGIRIQVHRAGSEVRTFTRNLNDVTERMPEVVEIVRSLPEERLVLDAEAIVLDADERPHLFQDTMSRVGRRAGHDALLVPWFFDVLVAGDDQLLDLPLSLRRDRLAAIAGEWRIPSIVTDDAGEAERFLGEALGAGHEGVMVKALGSVYQAGRRGKSWIKVKPARTLDLVVLAAEWGHGRRRGWLSNLHLGARGPGGTFVMVGKTFKGLTDETLAWQTTRLQEIESSREGITVRVRPELVVEIELDGVQSSTRYPGGVALRFARLKRYRPDKAPSDADTIEAVRALLPR
ncbi:MAG: ATP-dependent DNA ligase [Actinomycetota bacterium]